MTRARRSPYFIYERRSDPLLSRLSFFKRLFVHFVVTQALVAVSLAIGMGGYRYFENLGWRDAFLNASMLLGGMGPVDAPKTDGGKVFAGCYALYCGFVVIVGASVILAPVIHRIVHAFHGVEDKS